MGTGGTNGKKDFLSQTGGETAAPCSSKRTAISKEEVDLKKRGNGRENHVRCGKGGLLTGGEGGSGVKNPGGGGSNCFIGSTKNEAS